ncbi:MAG TPA: 1,4-alpha-glucan branching protein GlgB [Gammaproteobacteria bacterium]|nr:1,4-alpha-glucan branching protein GlgB [Gammaproteobacteria bacterium]
MVIRAFLPQAHRVQLQLPEIEPLPMMRVHEQGIFEIVLEQEDFLSPYQYCIQDSDGHQWQLDDPYRFPVLWSDYDLHLFAEGKNFAVYQRLGAHLRQHAEVDGVAFSVWAPNAERVSVVGNFNHWDGRIHPMRVRGSSGIWELFIPGLVDGETYKYEIRSKNGSIQLKIDPFAQQMEMRPATACIVHDSSQYSWQDQGWLVARKTRGQLLDRPVTIYEVHLGSWRREGEGFPGYRELAQQLVEYCNWMNYTHIELLPITEYPFDGSWGYQVTGYYAPTRRYGLADDFRYFVDYCHQHDLGVILDWVPAHFPVDSHGLACFDGTPLYEHADPRRGEHRDWGTKIFNFGRNEVRNFLISSALFWLEQYHLDGLRVDAVASMLYLDYSRPAGEWLPNKQGGRENLEAVAFLQELNQQVHERFPDVLTMAEESTSWPGVTRPVAEGGLGFSMKWNMGWMNDTLAYFSQDPVHRKYHHNRMTFSQVYAYSEHFILPFSHDEVVHEKGAMPVKMPGDTWQKFANLRVLYSYMATQPGKKLLFMGLEFGPWQEWQENTGLDWQQAQAMPHRGLQLLVRDLNHMVCSVPALYEEDFSQAGFQWLDCDDADQSVISFLRRDQQGGFVVVVLNLTPVPRPNYYLGVPLAGQYHEIFNSDADIYGGSNMRNAGQVISLDEASMGQPQSIQIVLPPLATLILQL